jgi:hypothetical protein
MSFYFPLGFFASQYKGLSDIILQIEIEKDVWRKKFLIISAYNYAKPSIWLMPFEHKNWNKIKTFYNGVQQNRGLENE